MAEFYAVIASSEDPHPVCHRGHRGDRKWIYRETPVTRLMEKRLNKKCQKFGAPQWVTSILLVAAKKRNDKLRRKKAYKMLQEQLRLAGIGKECGKYPTYVYADNIKALIRSIFPKGICNYPDPDHEKVVRVTMEDFFLMQP